jgi:hypothetical protein
MLKLNPTSKKSPPGGHQYREYGITFKGEKFSEVVTKVRDFRLHNNHPVGDPEQEVLCYYADHWPWLVKEDRDAAEPESPPDQYFLWREWLHRTWRNPPNKIITVKEAKDRWDKCEKCPFNQQFKHDETAESSELSRRAFLLRRGIEVPEFLGFCSCHAADLGAFSLI